MQYQHGSGRFDLDHTASACDVQRLISARTQERHKIRADILRDIDLEERRTRRGYAGDTAREGPTDAVRSSTGGQACSSVPIRRGISAHARAGRGNAIRSRSNGEPARAGRRHRQHIHRSGLTRRICSSARGLPMKPHVRKVNSEAKDRKKEEPENKNQRDRSLALFPAANITPLANDRLHT